MRFRYTLVTRTADELTLRCEVRYVTPVAQDLPATLEKWTRRPADGSWSADFDSGATISPVETEEIGKGEEDLDVAGKKLRCAWVEKEFNALGVRLIHKMWLSDQVPGGLVRDEISPEGTKEELKQTRVVVGFEARR